jgi:colicin import membrane protein
MGAIDEILKKAQEAAAAEESKRQKEAVGQKVNDVNAERKNQVAAEWERQQAEARRQELARQKEIDLARIEALRRDIGIETEKAEDVSAELRKAQEAEAAIKGMKLSSEEEEQHLRELKKAAQDLEAQNKKIKEQNIQKEGYIVQTEKAVAQTGTQEEQEEAIQSMHAAAIEASNDRVRQLTMDGRVVEDGKVVSGGEVLDALHEDALRESIERDRRAKEKKEIDAMTPEEREREDKEILARVNGIDEDIRMIGIPATDQEFVKLKKLRDERADLVARAIKIGGPRAVRFYERLHAEALERNELFDQKKREKEALYNKAHAEALAANEEFDNKKRAEKLAQMERNIRSLEDKYNRLSREYNKRLEAFRDRSNELQTLKDLWEDVKEMRAGQERIRKEMGSLPLPDGGKMRALENAESELRILKEHEQYLLKQQGVFNFKGKKDLQRMRSFIEEKQAEIKNIENELDQSFDFKGAKGYAERKSVVEERLKDLIRRDNLYYTEVANKWGTKFKSRWPIWKGLNGTNEDFEDRARALEADIASMSAMLKQAEEERDAVKKKLDEAILAERTYRKTE